MVFLIGKHRDSDPLRQACAKCFPRNGTLCHFDRVTRYEALRNATARVHPDLIVIDLSMDRDRQLSLIQKIRGDHRWEKVPVLAMSQHTDDSAAALTAGANGFLLTPAENTALTKAVRKLL